MNKEKYYVEYKIDTSHLEDWENQVVELLKEASKVIASLYFKQRNSDYLGANFYPHDVTKEELVKASKSDPLILHQFSVVKRDNNGKLYAVMYSEEYKKEIDVIVDLLKKTAVLYRENGNDLYSKYLMQLADDFKSDNGFEVSSLLWLKIGEYTGVDIKIGPIETYLDKLFAIKRAYQSNLRIQNIEESKNLFEVVDIVKALQPNLQFEKDDDFKLNLRMDNVIAMAGWHAELIPRGSNYPVDPDLIKREKIAKILIYSNNIEKRDGVLFDKILPLILDMQFDKLNRKLFMQTWLKFIVNHELTEDVAKYKYDGYEQRLGAYSEIVRELYSTLIGIKTSSVQVLKGVLPVSHYKYFLVEFVLVAFRDWVISVNGNSGLKAYSDGYVWCINYLFTTGALSWNEKKDKIIVDFVEIYSGIDKITTDLSYFMSKGKEKEVKEEITKYSDTTIFERFKNPIENVILKS